MVPASVVVVSEWKDLLARFDPSHGHAEVDHHLVIGEALILMIDLAAETDRTGGDQAPEISPGPGLDPDPAVIPDQSPEIRLPLFGLETLDVEQ